MWIEKWEDEVVLRLWSGEKVDNRSSKMECGEMKTRDVIFGYCGIMKRSEEGRVQSGVSGRKKVE